MADIGESELRSKIKTILKGADLTTLSAKKVRLQLQTELGKDLSERKKEIDKLTIELILSREGQESDDDATDVKNGNKAERSSSDEGVEDSPPKKKAKLKAKPAKATTKKASKVVASVKVKEPVDDDIDDDEDSKTNDEELAQRLQAEEEETGGRRSRHRSVKKTPVRKKNTPKKERKKREGTSTYSRPCLLSPELAKVMGTDKMARSGVVKRMWEIKKERNLHDQRDGRYMICDEELQSLFGKKRILAFGMMKYLKNHIKDEHDVAPSSITKHHDDDINDSS